MVWCPKSLLGLGKESPKHNRLWGQRSCKEKTSSEKIRHWLLFPLTCFGCILSLKYYLFWFAARLFSFHILYFIHFLSWIRNRLISVQGIHCTSASRFQGSLSVIRLIENKLITFLVLCFGVVGYCRVVKNCWLASEV